MEVTQFIANKEDRSYFDSLVENLKKCSEFKMSAAFIIGSSNITQRALKTNQEWNLLQSENCLPENHEPGYFAKSVLDEFNELWNSPFANEYSDDFLIAYRDYLVKNRAAQKQIREARKHNFFAYKNNKKTNDEVIKPNRMQQEAIANLAKLRESGVDKALAVAATG